MIKQIRQSLSLFLLAWDLPSDLNVVSSAATRGFKTVVNNPMDDVMDGLHLVTTDHFPTITKQQPGDSLSEKVKSVYQPHSNVIPTTL